MSTEEFLRKVHIFPSEASYEQNISKVTKEDLAVVPLSKEEIVEWVIPDFLSTRVSGSSTGDQYEAKYFIAPVDCYIFSISGITNSSWDNSNEYVISIGDYTLSGDTVNYTIGSNGFSIFLISLFVPKGTRITLAWSGSPAGNKNDRFSVLYYV